jgi:ABC-type multidrug transport system ATPase subunit
VNPGQFVTVLGPAGAGKSRLLNTLSGRQRSATGVVTAPEGTRSVAPGSLSGRQKVVSAKRNLSTAQTHLLAILGLWEQRHRTIAELSPGQIAAAEIFATFATSEPISLVLLDGQLDALDMPTRRRFELFLADLRGEGLIVVTATHDLGLAERSDVIAVLDESHIKFVGSPADLIRRAGPAEITVETQEQLAVRALVEPFSISAERLDSGWKLRAEEGQAVAAKLLTEGYGDIKWIILKTPTLAEALEKL